VGGHPRILGDINLKVPARRPTRALHGFIAARSFSRIKLTRCASQTYRFESRDLGQFRRTGILSRHIDYMIFAALTFPRNGAFGKQPANKRALALRVNIIIPKTTGKYVRACLEMRFLVEMIVASDVCEIMIWKRSILKMMKVVEDIRRIAGMLVSFKETDRWETINTHPSY